MTKSMSLIWDLQSIEKQMRTLKAEKQALSSDNIRCLWQQIAEIKKLSAENQLQLIKLQNKCQTQEEDLAKLQEHGRQLGEMLYGGSVTQAKELEKIQSQYNLFQLEVQRVEESLLTDMEKCESLQAEIKNQQDHIHTLNEQHGKLQQELARHVTKMEAEYQILNDSYEKLKQNIPAAYYNEYVKISRVKSMAVAKLEKGICSGCHVSIPTSHIVKDADKILYCENCGRMLLIE